MDLKTTGRKVTLKKKYLDMVEKRMAKFDRYFETDTEAAVTVTVEGGRQTVEVTLRSRGFIYRAERTAQDMEQAFNEAADLIDRQIVKNKSKLGSRIKKQEPEQNTQIMASLDIGEAVDDDYRIVREKKFPLKPMTTDEAILQMNMLQHSFFVFLNDETDMVNIVYRRHDDDYGLLIPEY